MEETSRGKGGWRMPNGRMVVLIVIIIVAVLVILALWWMAKRKDCTPPIPKNLSASVSNGLISLAWEEAKGADAYKVYISSEQGINKGNFAVRRLITGTSVTLKLADGTYYFRVSAVKGCNGFEAESDLSNEVSAEPDCTDANLPPPSALTLDPAGPGAVEVEWRAVRGAGSYVVYRAEGRDVSTSDYDEKVSTDETEVTFSGLASGSTQTFVVVSVNECGNAGEASKLLSYLVDCTNPASADINSVSVATTSITISWDAVSDTTGYVVYLAEGDSVSKTLYDFTDSTTSTSYIFSGLTAGTEYAVGVDAINLCGEGLLTYTVTTTDPALADPLRGHALADPLQGPSQGKAKKVKVKDGRENGGNRPSAGSLRLGSARVVSSPQTQAEAEETSFGEGGRAMPEQQLL